MIAIGIDPGSSSGAIAIMHDNSLIISDMKKTEHQISGFIFDQVLLRKQYGEDVFACIERVSAAPGQGVVSTFKFGTNYGFLRGLIVAHNVPFRDVLPKEWQKHYSMARKSSTTEVKGKKKTIREPKKEWKTRLLNVAQKLYPKENIPLYAADAVLLAHYAKQIIKS